MDWYLPTDSMLISSVYAGSSTLPRSTFGFSGRLVNQICWVFQVFFGFSQKENLV